MKHKCLIYSFSLIVFFTAGYSLGVWLHPKIEKKRIEKKYDSFKISDLFITETVDLRSGQRYTKDTLLAHEKNLLVFWSPTCVFCKQFFQNRLNSGIVGVFCFPLIDDLEYVNYFVEKYEIEYPQLIVEKNGNQTPVEANYVNAIPMFYIVDSHGSIIHEQYGIENIDELISELYKTNKTN